MSITVELPRFDKSDQVTLTQWVKEVGDQVEVGDVMVVLKIDGYTLYLVAFHYGILTEVFVTEGQRVKSGQAIAGLTPWPCPTPTSTTLGSLPGRTGI
jgi:pyruvate/2-oxoglutarate dehydrogenase complex dihydrolipoamide acyltransferase (E2) component